ncbi:Beta-galactosidase/beta-glucuronidase [Neorhodopirellula lusitana]|uniref:beta-galactosidase n=1 Tax=Neorhodopirellula lusitana TaxID=445327 RepID=A0ABY1PTE1_9BACT|nr:discoidin domain-containing protein [Neorhodopirellula lusitana]SMP46330.1 Beta-galactosidase/beta-glucuronidase [Neorhodopirellula lusitana]
MSESKRALIYNPMTSCIRFRTLSLILCVCLPCACNAETSGGDSIDLSGPWRVRLSDSDQSHEIQLPGALRDSGIGNAPGPKTKWIAGGRDEIWNRPEYKPYRRANNFKIPFWLQPSLHYVGKATYQREINIPDNWLDRQIVLTLERPHWLTNVIVDGKCVAKGESLGVAHRFDLTEHLHPGVHQLAIEVDNSIDLIDVGTNSHSVSDHTQSAWHGIVGSLELSAHPLLNIKRVDIHPNLNDSVVQADVVFSNNYSQPESRSVFFRIEQAGTTLATHQITTEIAPGESKVRVAIGLDSKALLWDEFEPNLCDISVQLQKAGIPGPVASPENISSSKNPLSEWKGRFGFREIEARDGRLMLNHRPIYLRGTLECCIFPLTGYPPTDDSSWRRIIRICKKHGLNHIRFHSWCPPEAAFRMADEMGFYFQVECSTWPNQSISLGHDLPIDQWIYREADRMLSEYGNHPSFVLLCAGNEPAGQGSGGTFLTPWVNRYKEQENRVLVTAGAGWPMIAANEYHVTPHPRIQQWGQQLNSRINAHPPETVTDYDDYINRYDVPVVAHEIGQWCAYPNFDEIPKYTGALKPKNFEVFRDFLQNEGMLDQAHDFLMASGRWQVLTYKEEIESALRTRHFGGFQLLDMRDFPGQGTALVGMLDPFWDPKPYMDANEFRKFCGPVVPLVRMKKRVWKSNETFDAEIEVSHFGHSPLDGIASWQIHLASQGKDTVIAKGKWPLKGQKPGDLYSLGTIQVPLAKIAAAAKLNIEVTVPDGNRSATNDWDFWVYPADSETEQPDDSPDAHSTLAITKSVAEAVAAAKQGKRVLLTLPPDHVATDVQIGMSPIFWNWAWTNGQAPHTMGILCDPDHACLKGFPTEFHSNWQWWDLISKSAAMPLDQMSTDIKPLIQVVPNWFIPKKLALAWEANVGEGRVLVTSVDLSSDMTNRPAAKQFLTSLKRYITSTDFNPAQSVTESQLNSLVRKLSQTQLAIQSTQASSKQRGYESSKAFDGNLATMWHTQWSPLSAGPHWLQINMHHLINLNGMIVTPRQDQPRTRLRGYEISTLDQAGNWQTVASGEFDSSATPKTVRFLSTVQTSALRLQARPIETDGKNRPPQMVSIAELELLLNKRRNPQQER